MPGANYKKGRFILNGLCLLAVASLTTACSLTQTPYAQLTGETGSSLSAASNTLKYAHSGKLTYAYARSSFALYENSLEGVADELPQKKGRDNSSASSVQQLVAEYQAAFKIVQQPCLSDDCDWQSQTAALDQASQMFLKESDPQQ